VIGLTYAMGLNIDPFSTICFVCGIGLCVDYGIHIAHFFSVAKGSKTERAINAFVSISPAIFHGGTSTILALVPLAFSESHGFTTFFRINTSIVCFGIFHGLFFLPVMLILFGSDNNEEEIHLKNVLPDSVKKTSTYEWQKHQEKGEGINNPDFDQEE